MKYYLRLCGAAMLFAASVQSLPANAGDQAQLPFVVGKATLTVTGADYWHRHTYNDGEVPVLSAYDGSGQLLPDGVYRYEFRALSESPAAAPRQQDLLDLNDHGKQQFQVQRTYHSADTVSGSFAIQAGEVISR